MGTENVVCPNCASEDWTDVTGFDREDFQLICNECSFTWEVERDL